MPFDNQREIKKLHILILCKNDSLNNKQKSHFMGKKMEEAWPELYEDWIVGSK